jgi:hypothetical protein
MMYALKYVAREHQRIRGELDGAKSASQIALLELTESIVHDPGSPIEEDVVHTGGEQLAVYNTLHMQLGVQSDPIPPDTDLGRFPVVIVSQPLFLSSESAKKLRAYLEVGGRLLVTGPVGLYDEHGFPDGRFLRDVAGVASATRRPAPKEIRFTSGLKVRPGSKKAKMWKYSLIDDPKIEVLARFPDDSPAVLRRPVGKGQIVVTAYGLRQTRNIAEQLRQLVLPHVKPPARTDLPARIFAMEKDDKILLFVYNRDLSAVKTSLRFPQTLMVEDLRAGVRLKASEVPLLLSAGEMRIFRIPRDSSP